MLNQSLITYILDKLNSKYCKPAFRPTAQCIDLFAWLSVRERKDHEFRQNLLDNDPQGCRQIKHLINEYGLK